MKPGGNRFNDSYSIAPPLHKSRHGKTPMVEIFFIQAENIHKLFTFLM
jgi:hypothetical protein